MELGATICLPQALRCACTARCMTFADPRRTRHRAARHAESHPVAFLLATRKRGMTTEVLLERRAAEASLMPGMLELPPLPLDAGRGPRADAAPAPLPSPTPTTTWRSMPESHLESDGMLREAVPASADSLSWYGIRRLGGMPLTGLARKVLKRVNLYEVAGPETPEQRLARERQMEEIAS